MLEAWDSTHRLGFSRSRNGEAAYNPQLMKQHRSASRIARLAIIAVLWHALMPLAYAAAMRQASLASICSVDARRTDTTAPIKQGERAADLLMHCPLCASGTHTAIADGPKQHCLADPTLAHVERSFSPGKTTHVLAWLIAAPRAPPQA